MAELCTLHNIAGARCCFPGEDTASCNISRLSKSRSYYNQVACSIIAIGWVKAWIYLPVFGWAEQNCRFSCHWKDGGCIHGKARERLIMPSVLRNSVQSSAATCCVQTTQIPYPLQNSQWLGNSSRFSPHSLHHGIINGTYSPFPSLPLLISTIAKILLKGGSGWLLCI